MPITSAVCVVVLLTAATPPDGGSGATQLSLTQAVERALERHPAVLAAELGLEGAKSRTAVAETAWLPRVDLEASYRASGPTPSLSIDTGITPPGATEPIKFERELGSIHSAAVDLKVGWRAWDFGARSARIDAAEAMEAAAAAQGRGRRAQIARAVRIAYLSARFSREVVTTTRETLRTAQQAVDLELARQRAGLGSEVGVAGARTRVAEIEAQLAEARGQQRRADAALRLLLGLPASTQLALTDDLASSAGAEASEATRPTPQVEELEATARGLELQHTALGRSFWPTFDLFASVGVHYPHTFVETDQAGVVWAAGVMMKWPLFDGDMTWRQRTELEVRQRQTRQLQEAAREEASREETDARERLAAARRTEAAASKRVAAAQTFRDAAVGARKAGTATALDVQQAEAALAGARLSVSKAQLEAGLANAQLLAAQGRTGLESEEGDR